jgi:hypothetical protein
MDVYIVYLLCLIIVNGVCTVVSFLYPAKRLCIHFCLFTVSGHTFSTFVFLLYTALLGHCCNRLCFPLAALRYTQLWQLQCCIYHVERSYTAICVLHHNTNMLVPVAGTERGDTRTDSVAYVSYTSKPHVLTGLITSSPIHAISPHWIHVPGSQHLSQENQ